MGQYVNPGNRLFWMSARTDTYVDKSMLLKFMNSRMDTDRRFICVSKPRKFGKSVDASMIAAYYSSGCDSGELFSGLEIAGNPGYEEHLNRHSVIYLNMSRICRADENISDMTGRIEEEIRHEIVSEYPEAIFISDHILYMLSEACRASGRSFIIVIDDWDLVFRNAGRSEDEITMYLCLLKRLFTDNEFISLVYMTGVLPARKYSSPD
ncbi:MAG: AAA family ATPase [Clostridia bacterium]|nr:AAA family ATPase [Clostridia bacterium]